MEALDPLQRALASRAVNRADAIAAKYARVFPHNTDDIKSAAYWGAVKAATEYDKARAESSLWSKWSKWANYRICYAVKDYLRSVQLPRDVQLADDDENGIAGRTETNRIDDLDEIQQLVMILTPIQRKLVQATLDHEGSIEKAADALGMNHRTAHSYYQRAISRLREKCYA